MLPIASGQSTIVYVHAFISRALLLYFLTLTITMIEIGVLRTPRRLDDLNTIHGYAQKTKEIAH